MKWSRRALGPSARAAAPVVDTADRIRASGLFDPLFYQKTYPGELAGWDDPLEHFLAVGLPRGYLPSADFDPVLYRILVPECGDANPLLHYLDAGLPFQPPAVREVFAQVAAQLPRFDRTRDLELERNRAYARSAMQIREMPFAAGGRKYALRVPEAEVLLGRLREDRPFAFARLPHGFWDSLWQLDEAKSKVAADPRGRRLPPAQREALAMRLCTQRYPRAAAAFAGQFLQEVLADIPVHADRPDFLRAVAFSGFPTFRESAIAANSPRGIALTSLVAAHFRPDEPLYDAMIWKRMLMAGQLKELPRLCRDHPVVLITSGYFSELPERWQLERFHHVVIPPAHSQGRRREILERARAAVSAATSHGSSAPIVLTQCGGSLAFWFITRLFAEFPRAFYLDLGQALDPWFLDVLPANIRSSRWLRTHASSIIANCGLEDYYRRLQGDGWRESLSLAPAPPAAGKLPEPPAYLAHSGGYHHRKLGKTWLGLIVEQGRLPRDGAVLDVGCGLGRMAGPLMSYLGASGRYEGFDIDAEAVRWCQSNIASLRPNFRFTAVDLHSVQFNPGGAASSASFAFPYEDDTFDVAFLSSVFTHVLPDTVERYLHELARVLKPGGRCLASYFLLNDVSERAIAEGRVRDFHRFPQRLEGCRVLSLEVPEKAVAHEEPRIIGLYAKSGLRIIEPIRYGTWAGRVARTGQDIVLSIKE